MKKIIFAIAAFALILSGCDNDLTPENASPAVFRASINQDLTKATMDGLHINWIAGDEVFIGAFDGEDYYGVTGKTNYATYSVQSAGSTSDLVYSSGKIMTKDLLEEGEVFAAFSPRRLITGINKRGLLTYELPRTQEYITDGLVDLPMMAVSASYSLDFNALCGLLKLNLKAKETGVAVKSITVEADEYLCGEMDITEEESFSLIFDDEEYDYDDSNKKVTLDCGTGVALDTDVATPFYITIPEGEYTNMKIKVVFTDDTQTSFTSNRTIDIELNGMYTINKSVGGGAPVQHETVTVSKYTEDEIRATGKGVDADGCVTGFTSGYSKPDCGCMLNFAVGRNTAASYAGWRIKSVNFRFRGGADSAEAIIDFGSGITTIGSTTTLTGGIANVNSIDVSAADIRIPSSGDIWVGYILRNVSDDMPMYYAGGGVGSGSALAPVNNESKATIYNPDSFLWLPLSSGGYGIWLIDLVLENPS